MVAQSVVNMDELYSTSCLSDRFICTIWHLQSLMVFVSNPALYSLHSEHWAALPFVVCEADGLTVHRAVYGVGLCEVVDTVNQLSTVSLTVVFDSADLGHGGGRVGPEDGLAVLSAGGVTTCIAAACRAHCRDTHTCTHRLNSKNSWLRLGVSKYAVTVPSGPEVFKLCQNPSWLQSGKQYHDFQRNEEFIIVMVLSLLFVTLSQIHR